MSIRTTLWRVTTVLLVLSLVIPSVQAAAPHSSLPLAMSPAPSTPVSRETSSSRPDTLRAEWDALPPDVQAKVDPRILAELWGEIVPAHLRDDPEQALAAPWRYERPDKTRFIVHLRARVDMDAVPPDPSATEEQRRQAVFDALVSIARTSQEPVKQALDARAAAGDVAGYQSFYIFNGLAVEGDMDTVIELAKREDVERIVANYPLTPLWGDGDTTASPDIEVGGGGAGNWNVSLVGADQVWSELGVTGEGVVVANIDTGVDWTHPALQNKYRGYNAGGPGVHDHNYSWFDPDPALYANGDLGPSRTTQPFDDSDHGTHTMGTMVGDGGTTDTKVGLAPGAKWVAVSLSQLEGSVADDIMAYKAFQWVLCPTDLTGALSTADCSRAPNVVNNSWGSANPADDTFRPIIQTLRAAGVVPVFAAGNPSVGSGSIGSPGSAPEAITVGATDAGDVVASFSGRGPSFYEGEQKPELSAPGVNIRSTVPNGGYANFSGTSMAAPHVAGLVALMVSADLQDGTRDLNVDELERFMEYTAVDLGDLGPDDDYGYGRIAAYDAVRWVLSAGDLGGIARDAVTHAPIEGTTITGVSTDLGDTFTTQTDAGGWYAASVPAGTYSVTVEAWGYYSATFPGQMVITGVLSIADFSLTPMPTATLSGQVLYETAPVEGAAVYVADQPTVRVETGADGAYTLTLPIGSHEMVIEAAGHRILREEVDVTASGGTHDFAMTAAPTILLVDADTHTGWFGGWPVRNFFKWSLDREGYLYDLWVIQYTNFNDTKTMPDGSLGYGIPSASTLGSYDLVIWAHGGGGYWSLASPGAIGADDELASYLDGGGRLILSGQDIGFDDGRDFYDDYLRANRTLDDAAGEGDTVSGQGFLTGLNLEITNASLHGYNNGATYLSPDAASAESGAAFAVLNYDNGNGLAALAVDPCDASYRVVYFALGYENIGPRAGDRDPAIAEVLDRSIVWAMGSKPPYDVDMVATPARQVSDPGDTATYHLQVINTGSRSATFELSLSGDDWQTRVMSGTDELSQPITILPCGLWELTLEVDIPATASAGAEDTVTVTVSRQHASTPSASAEVTTVAFPQWQVESPMPTPRYRLAAASSPDGIYYYAIGGQDYYGISANERYNACTGQWEEMAPMPTARANTEAAVINGKVYIPAGWADGTYFSVLEIYDPATDSWSTGAPMPVALSGPAVAAHGGKLYVFGGRDTVGYLSKTYEYDPVTDTWTEKAPMPGGGRAFAAAAELDGKIYVVGGWSSESTVEVYDPAADSWTTAASMNAGRQSPGVAAAPDGYLYVSGGGSGWTGLDSVERYDPTTDTWMFVSSLKNDNRAGTASAYAAGKLFAVGGSGNALSDANESLQLGNAFCLSDKSAQQDTVQPGGRITYTIEIRSDAVYLASASLTDPIPVGTTFAGFGFNPIGATYNSTSDQVEWSGAVPANVAPMTFTFGIDVAPDHWVTGDIITNSVTFDSGDGLVFVRIATSRLSFPDPSASVKEVDKSLASAGDVLTYTIHVENASNIGDVFSLHDPIPANATYVPGSLSYDLGTAHYDSAEDAIVWTGTLPPVGAYVNTSDSYEWGDSDGNGAVPDVDFDWVDVRMTGEPISLSLDRYAGPLDIGFPFDFYGDSYTQFYISSHGYLSFGTGSAYYTNHCLPNPIPPNNIIALMWDDLNPGITGDKVYYQTFSSCPVGSGACLVVQYDSYHLYSDGSVAGTFEAILYDTGAIQVQILDAGSLEGSSSTTGIENDTGTVGKSYVCDTPDSLHDDLAVLFLPPGGSIAAASTEITFSVTTAASLPVNTWITNTVTITGSYNAVVRSAGTLINAVDLGRSWKRADKDLVAVGEMVTYDFLLWNDGSQTADGATLIDPVPSGMTYVPGSVDCSSGSCEYTSGAVSWTGDIAPGGTVTLTFAATLTATLPSRTPVTNTAHLDDGFGNIYDLQDVFVTSAPDLTRSFKRVTPSVLDPGETATYTIYVYNSGDGPTTAEVRDELPSELIYETNSLVCGSGSCSYASGVVTWMGTVAPHSMVPVRFRAVVSPAVGHGEWITNTATVSNAYDTVPCSAEVLVNPVDLSGSWKHADKTQAVPGETVSYDLHLENTGVSTATASLNDPLPSSTTYVPGSVDCSDGSCDYDSGAVTWTGDIAPGEVVTLTFAATLTTPLPDHTVVTNTAQLDDGLGHLNDLAAGFQARSSDLSSSHVQVDPGEVALGGVVTYTITISNDGVVATTGEMRDVLPSGLDFVPGSLTCSAGSCGYADGVVTWTGDVDPHSTVTVRFQVTVTAGAGPDTPTVNRVVITDKTLGTEHACEVGVMTTGWLEVYVPLAMRNASP
jgi:uncharacterized repeat protein (TIGR01451 family)